MPNIYSKKVVPPKYTTLQAEDNYSCDSSCTCKFILDRSNYDVMQWKIYSQQQKDQNILNSMLNKNPQKIQQALSSKTSKCCTFPSM